MNNTETYWEADGQSLHTFARSIETLSGMGPPPLRGEDITIASQPGQQWVEKIPDSNTLTLAMWLRGVDQDAGSGASATNKKQYQSNWNDLMRLLWTPGRQVALRKRFYDGLILRQATGRAEYAGGLQPTLIGNSAARCTIDLKIAGAFFYDDNLQTVPLVNGDNNIIVLGNAPTHNIGVTINGARANVRLRNVTHSVEFTYPRPLLSGHSATIGVLDYEAQHSGGGPAFDSSSDIIHTGAPQWLVLRPGLNVINLSADSGTGSVVLQYRGAWV